MEGQLGEIILVMLDEGFEQCLACQEEAVALPLIAQGVAISFQRPSAPELGFARNFLGALLGVGDDGVFGHNAELAIEDSDALREGYEFAGHGVVATHEIRPLAAGDFHAGGADIVLPRLAFGENDALGRRLPAVVAFVADVEHVGTSEPGFVDEVVLRIANPGRGEDLGHLLGAVELLLARLEHARLNEVPMFAGDALGRDSVVPLIAGTEVGVVIGGPKDGALRRVVEQQGGEHLRIAAQKLTFGDINFVGDHVCEKEEGRLLTKVVICLCRTKDLRNNTLNLHAKKAFCL